MISLRMIAAFGALALSGCGGISLIDSGPPPRLFDIAAEVRPQATMAPVAWQLLIEEPKAPKSLDTARVVVRSGANEIRFYANARWTDRAPSLVQTALVRGFEASGKIVGIGRQAMGLRGDYTLIGELRAFEARYAPGAETPLARIDLTFKLVRQPSAQIVGSRTYDVSVPVAGAEVDAVVAGLETALSQIVAEAVVWALEEGERDYVIRAKAARLPVPMRNAQPAEDRSDPSAPGSSESTAPRRPAVSAPPSP